MSAQQRFLHILYPNMSVPAGVADTHLRALYPPEQQLLRLFELLHPVMTTISDRAEDEDLVMWVSDLFAAVYPSDHLHFEEVAPGATEFWRTIEVDRYLDAWGASDEVVADALTTVAAERYHRTIHNNVTYALMKSLIKLVFYVETGNATIRGYIDPAGDPATHHKYFQTYEVAQVIAAMNQALVGLVRY